MTTLQLSIHSKLKPIKSSSIPNIKLLPINDMIQSNLI